MLRPWHALPSSTGEGLHEAAHVAGIKHYTNAAVGKARTAALHCDCAVWIIDQKLCFYWHVHHFASNEHCIEAGCRWIMTQHWHCVSRVGVVIMPMERSAMGLDRHQHARRADRNVRWALLTRLHTLESSDGRYSARVRMRARIWADLSGRRKMGQNSTLVDFSPIAGPQPHQLDPNKCDLN